MSDDDNIIPFGKPDQPPTIRELIGEDPNTIPVILPDGIVRQIEFGEKPLGFDDLGAAFNMRDWFQHACEAKGGKMVGGGFGFGAADLDIEIEGHRYNLTIRPTPRS